VSFLVCGGIEAGALRGEGLGTGVVHRTQVQPWVAVAASPGIVWAPVPAFGLFARADVLVSLYRPGFHFEGIETLHRAGIAAGRGVFGLEVRFP
jgi:hypothetical protein